MHTQDDVPGIFKHFTFFYRTDINNEFSNLPKEERDERKRIAFTCIASAVNSGGKNYRTPTECYYKMQDYKSKCKQRVCQTLVY